VLGARHNVARGPRARRRVSRVTRG